VAGLASYLNGKARTSSRWYRAGTYRSSCAEYEPAAVRTAVRIFTSDAGSSAQWSEIEQEQKRSLRSFQTNATGKRISSEMEKGYRNGKESIG
jgi:Tfp pilus assembly protein PilX